MKVRGKTLGCFGESDTDAAAFTGDLLDVFAVGMMEGLVHARVFEDGCAGLIHDDILGTANTVDHVGEDVIGKVT